MTASPAPAVAKSQLPAVAALRRVLLNTTATNAIIIAAGMVDLSRRLSLGKTPDNQAQ